MWHRPRITSAPFRAALSSGAEQWNDSKHHVDAGGSCNFLKVLSAEDIWSSFVRTAGVRRIQTMTLAAAAAAAETDGRRAFSLVGL